MKKTLFPLFLLSLAVLATASPAWAATIMVTTTADENGTGAACSLREAITAANTNATFGGCPAGSAGTNTITFQAGLMGTITLGSALPTITQPLVIAGPGAADITVDGGADTFDGFVASGIASLQVSGLTLTDFLNAIDATGVDVALTAVVITSSGEGGAVTTTWVQSKLLAVI